MGLITIDTKLKSIMKEIEEVDMPKENYLKIKKDKKNLDEKLLYLNKTKADLIDRIEVLECEKKIDSGLIEHLTNYSFLIQLEIDKFERLVDIKRKELKDIESEKKAFIEKKNVMKNLTKRKLNEILEADGELKIEVEKLMEKIQGYESSVTLLEEALYKIDLIYDFLDSSEKELNLINEMSFSKKYFYFKKENPYDKINNNFKEIKNYLEEMNIQDMDDLKLSYNNDNLLKLISDKETINHCLIRVSYYKDLLSSYKYNLKNNFGSEKEELELLKTELKTKIIECK